VKAVALVEVGPLLVTDSYWPGERPAMLLLFETFFMESECLIDPSFLSSKLSMLYSRGAMINFYFLTFLKLMLYMLILDIIELMCCSNSVSCFFS
jgi:hypothetical protein